MKAGSNTENYFNKVIQSDIGICTKKEKNDG
jgi:hypothetical protein